MKAIFLQVRLGSTRLPRKALLPLANRAVIEHAMASLREVPADVYLLVTDEASAGELREYAHGWGFEVFAGDSEDVLGRFVAAAESCGAETIVRATGDNPLVSRRIVEESCSLFHRYECDFAALDGPPLGTAVEVVRGSALVEAHGDNPDRYEREHVTPFLYRRPGRFRIVRRLIHSSFCYPDARVTLDTEEDYALLTRVYDALYGGEPIEVDQLIAWLQKHEAVRRMAVRDSA